MATTEEMNVTISLYMGLVYENGHLWRGEEAASNFLFEYNLKWDYLMPVWDKLRQDLLNTFGATVFNMFNTKVSNHAAGIQRQIAEEVDITEAHRLIYEAIVWLNQNKGK